MPSESVVHNTDAMQPVSGTAAVPGTPGWFAWLPDALKAIRNPMIFNACAIIVMSCLVYGGVRLEFNWFRGVFLSVAVAFNIGVTSWLNVFAWKNPRFLAYGPDEYLRESELEHQRKMAGIVGTVPPASVTALPQASVPVSDAALQKGQASK